MHHNWVHSTTIRILPLAHSNCHTNFSTFFGCDWVLATHAPDGVPAVSKFPSTAENPRCCCTKHSNSKGIWFVCAQSRRANQPRPRPGFFFFFFAAFMIYSLLSMFHIPYLLFRIPIHVVHIVDITDAVWRHLCGIFQALLYCLLLCRTTQINVGFTAKSMYFHVRS